MTVFHKALKIKQINKRINPLETITRQSTPIILQGNFVSYKRNIRSADSLILKDFSHDWPVPLQNAQGISSQLILLCSQPKPKTDEKMEFCK